MASMTIAALGLRFAPAADGKVRVWQGDMEVLLSRESWERLNACVSSTLEGKS